MSEALLKADKQHHCFLLSSKPIISLGKYMRLVRQNLPLTDPY